MHVPRLALLKFSSWWSRPKVCPTSWQVTSCRHAGVLYCAMAKYVSLSFTEPRLMWLPVVTLIDATPSQPVVPYAALQTSTWPVAAVHEVRLPNEPVWIVVFSLDEAVQSDDAVDR